MVSRYPKHASDDAHGSVGHYCWDGGTAQLMILFYEYPLQMIKHIMRMIQKSGVHQVGSFSHYILTVHFLYIPGD